ncbi:ABC transporter ATP-binding protein [Halobellus captivus]|uniref:ABC transporter ATP-binding protein n=1 Tax=Halobellus captivus TaxID=2592614 RepID=UPI0011A6525B|nr:ABC transporter ATP-binding protein [Halobellus captivus]
MMVTITDLSVRRGDFSFGPLDLSISNEVFCVLGPSGSGKSTLLSILAGIVEPDRGEILIGGESVRGRPPETRSTGLVFQDGALFPHLTARENVEYAAEDPDYVRKLTRLLAVDEVLDRRPAMLSGGERQRVALARTLAAGPDVLLLDEPLSSLDEPIRRRLRDDLHRLFATLDVPVVYVTHDQRTATALADRLGILRDGRLEQVDTPTSVLERPNSRFVAEFTGNENVFEVGLETGRCGRVARLGDALLRVTAEGDSIERLLAGVDGSTATVCAHPSRITVLERSDGSVDAVRSVDSEESGRDLRMSADESSFRIPVTIERWLHEGDTYRVFVQVDGGPELTATMSRRTFDRLELARGDERTVSIQTESMHVLDPPTSSRT